ncbi:MAG: flagellar hook-basal body complex protein [Verrucomicrobiota bacterium]
MNVGIYQAINGMLNQWEHQNTVSANLSRSAIPGARAEIQTFGSMLNHNSQLQDPDKGTLGLHEKHYDFSQGPLQKSDSPYHLAIEGRAFFSVLEPEGQTSFTRNGQFVRGTDTLLRTTDGAMLLDVFGATISIPDGGEFVVSREGMIQVDGQNYGQIGTAYFQDPSQQLALSKFGRFEAKGDQEPVPGLAVGDTLSQYTLEGSNIKPVEEMIHMIQLTRAFEANQKVVKESDRLTEELLRIANP